jgi:peroxiredoxin
LRGLLPEIRRRGAELVVVGNGSPVEAAAFQVEVGLDFPLFVDPGRRAYAAAGLRRGASTVLRLNVFRRGLDAWQRGFRQGKIAGDPWQQGGVFVIRPDGDVRLAHVSREAGDHPEPAVLLAALDPDR